MWEHKKLIFFLFFVPLCVLGVAFWHLYEMRVIRLNYEGFTVWLDCSKRGAVKFWYVAKRDGGNLERVHIFSTDPRVPERCQQKSTALYTSNEEVHYDRGHLVPANHFDHSQKALKQTNYVTNIVPQAREMNRGAWLRTEEIVECYRDTFELVVVGGVLWGNNKADDYFLKSHGIATPDAFWKVLVRDGHDVIGWIIPNSVEAKRERLDTYIVSVAEIESRIKKNIADVPRRHTDDKPQKSWPIPVGCSKK